MKAIILAGEREEGLSPLTLEQPRCLLPLFGKPLLARQAGKVLTYDYLMRQIWGPYSDDNNQILRVNMAHIRRKLEKNPAEPEYIFTEIGVGYRMKEET